MSSLFELDHPKDEAAAAFVAEVGRRLQRALLERKGIEKITQQEIATRLGVDRSRVNKCFSGFANLSLESLAELCWAMDVEPHIERVQLLNDQSNCQGVRFTGSHVSLEASSPNISTTKIPGAGVQVATGSEVRNRVFVHAD